MSVWMYRWRSLHALSAILLWSHSTYAQLPQTAPGPTERQVIVEVFLRGDDSAHQEVLDAVNEFSMSRQGVLLHVHDISNDQREVAAQRLEKIRDALRLNEQQLPLIYSCGSAITGGDDIHNLVVELDTLLRIDVYVRAGCSRCNQAKAFLSVLLSKYPAFEVRFRDLVSDANARRSLNRLVTQYGKSAASVPVVHVCNQLIVGFDSANTTGRRIEKVLNYWTVPEREQGVSLRTLSYPHIEALSWGRVNLISLTALDVSHVPYADDTNADANDGRVSDAPMLPIPIDENSFADDAWGDPNLAPLDSRYGEDLTAIDLPWVGRLAASEWGMPLFTIMVGLVDGFNPCAMWVLLFLLSILVNLRDRVRILAVAGTFIAISGMAYFAFMAAWLNVFLLIGFLRPIQIALGLTAIAVGSIHVKDFFAFKKGISLSIPDSVKPSIYQRTRQIVNAENLWGALAAASVLAVFVNVVELLCTAGLPALYTEVLTLQGWPAWKNYAYLLLYNVAYMFDDGLMVACVVATLSKTKMQETHGRWLKLVSGIAIAVLGMIMLVRPEWLS